MNVYSKVFSIIVMKNIFLGKNCKEQNLFMAISEDVDEAEIQASHAVDLPEIEPITPPSDPS
jgi:hypothetical protein